jgi:hypothetical protein
MDEKQMDACFYCQIKLVELKELNFEKGSKVSKPSFNRQYIKRKERQHILRVLKQYFRKSMYRRN